MFPINSLDPNLPPNLPTLNISQEDTEEGWRKVPVGTLVRTTTQTFSLFPRPRWKLSAYWTSDGFKNGGYANYREPASLAAWWVVLKLLPSKWWHRFFPSR